MSEAKKLNPFLAYKDLLEYLIDAGQRTVLYGDVMRQRGNHYQEHMTKTAPHVLQFDHDLILDGRTLPQPVNYGIIKIRPPEGTVIDDRKRPFVGPGCGRGTALQSPPCRPPR